MSTLFCWIVLAGYVAGLVTRALMLSLQAPGTSWRELMPLTLLGFAFPLLAVLIGALAARRTVDPCQCAFARTA